jgi:uncharacterized protein YgiM (DUF1202 family)
MPALRRARLSLMALVVGLGAASEPARAQPEATAPDAEASAGAAEAEIAPPPEKSWIRGSLKLNFRSAPNAQATPLGILETGDAVAILERRSDWVRIETDDEQTGWIPESYLDPEGPETERLRELEGELTGLREELAAAYREITALEASQETLEARDAEREALFQQLDEENRVLRAGERWPFLIMGAAILGAGFIGGLLMRGGAGRRSSSRIRF